MIRSVVYEYHFPPSEIREMYCDDFDFQGLMYWYEELLRIEKESKKNK